LPNLWSHYDLYVDGQHDVGLLCEVKMVKIYRAIPIKLNQLL